MFLFLSKLTAFGEAQLQHEKPGAVEVAMQAHPLEHASQLGPEGPVGSVAEQLVPLAQLPVHIGAAEAEFIKQIINAPIDKIFFTMRSPVFISLFI